MKISLFIAVVFLVSGCKLIERITDNVASKNSVNAVSVGTGSEEKKSELVGQDTVFTAAKLPVKLYWRVESVKDMGGTALVISRYTGGKAYCLDTTFTLSVTSSQTHVMMGTIPAWYKGKYRIIAYLKTDWKEPIDTCDFVVK